MDDLTSNAKPLGDVFKFVLGTVPYSIGMYPHPVMKQDARAELRAAGVAVVQRNWTWEDVEENFTSDGLAARCITAFNKYLAAHHKLDGAEAEKYEQRMAEFFRTRLELVGNQLVIQDV